MLSVFHRITNLMYTEFRFIPYFCSKFIFLLLLPYSENIMYSFVFLIGILKWYSPYFGIFHAVWVNDQGTQTIVWNCKKTQCCLNFMINLISSTFFFRGIILKFLTECVLKKICVDVLILVKSLVNHLLRHFWKWHFSLAGYLFYVLCILLMRHFRDEFLWFECLKTH